MRIIAILTLFTAPFLANGMSVTQVVDKAKGFSAVVITVPAAENHGFSLLDVPSKREGDTIRAYWNSTNHLVMINGGYFNPEFSPTGLCRVDGKVLSTKRSKKLSGFIGIDKAGKLHVLTRQDELEKYPTVLQAGPFVIDPGGQIGIRSRSGVQAKRTLVGLTKSDDLVIIVTEPIYLLDLAKFISKQYPSIERLLNLDGGPSTALMTEDRAVVNTWPVRNYIFKKKETPTKPWTATRNSRAPRVHFLRVMADVGIKIMNSQSVIVILMVAMLGLTLFAPMFLRNLKVVFWTVFIGYMVLFIPVAFLDPADVAPVHAPMAAIFGGLVCGGIACFLFWMKGKCAYAMAVMKIKSDRRKREDQRNGSQQGPKGQALN